MSTAEVAGSPSPEGVTVSPDSGWAFVTLQGRNRVITVDLADARIVGWADRHLVRWNRILARRRRSLITAE